METIEVRYKPLFTPLNGNTIYHKYYVYTDASGNQEYARGGPTPFGWPFPLGDIQTQHGPYVDPDLTGKDSPDWDRENDNPREIIQADDDLKSKWEDVKRTIDDIEREKHSYEPEKRNSNTTIDTTSKRVGLPETKLDKPGGLNTPGSDNDIRSPLEQLIDKVKELVDRARSAFVPPRRDPLILDLDGDGFETSGTNTAIVHFDHDGDGFERNGDILLFRNDILPRPPARAQARFQPQAPGRARDPGGRAERGGPVHAVSQGRKLHRRFGRVHPRHPVTGQGNGAFMDKTCLGARQARPAPVLGPFHQSCPQGIALDVAQDG